MMGIIDSLGLPTGAKVLELGCGVGNLKLWFPGCEMHGVDIDGNALMEAKRNGYKTFLCDAMKFKPTEHYDLIFSAGLFEHFSIKELQVMCKRIAKWGNRTLTLVPSTSGLRGLIHNVVGRPFPEMHNDTLIKVFKSVTEIRAVPIFMLPHIPAKLPFVWFWAIVGETGG